MQLFEDNEDESNSVDKSGSDNTAEGGEYSNIINNTEEWQALRFSIMLIVW